MAVAEAAGDDDAAVAELDGGVLVTRGHQRGPSDARAGFDVEDFDIGGRQKAVVLAADDKDAAVVEQRRRVS